jgi:hypothetical protein
MEKLKEGSKVTCGICSKETTVSIVTEREGVAAYDLVCWHRNAICPKCGELVRDASEVVQEIHPHCEKCDGPYYDDDDKDDE